MGVKITNLGKPKLCELEQNLSDKEIVSNSLKNDLNHNTNLLEKFETVLTQKTVVNLFHVKKETK